jgi:hypothetical protein
VLAQYDLCSAYRLNSTSYYLTPLRIVCNSLLCNGVPIEQDGVTPLVTWLQPANVRVQCVEPTALWRQRDLACQTRGAARGPVLHSKYEVVLILYIESGGGGGGLGEWLRNANWGHVKKGLIELLGHGGSCLAFVLCVVQFMNCLVLWECGGRLGNDVRNHVIVILKEFCTSAALRSGRCTPVSTTWPQSRPGNRDVKSLPL